MVRKIIIVLTSLILTIFIAKAQVISLFPEKPSFGEEVTLTFRADEGNKELADFSGVIYAHTGLLTLESANEGDWKHVVADWNQNSDKVKLNKVGRNEYQFKFNISELYGIPTTGGGLVALAFVFRNADGSRVGRAKEDKNIYYYFQQPNFKTTAQVYTESKTVTPEWSRYATIYEVNIRQYTEEGTINAFVEHLPRLRDLGVDILWLMPIQPIGEKKRKGPLGSYYSIQNYTAVNPKFGTLDDFKRLVQKAHGMGFKVVLDWVANHSAWDNPWIEQHPDWYAKDDAGNMIAPYDWTDVAKLDYDKYYLRKAMTNALLFWVREADIDGFRCDVAGEVPADFWEDVRAKLDEEKNIWMIAENEDQHYLLNTAFNANYAWGFHHKMNEVAKGNASAAELMSVIEEKKNKLPKGAYPMNFVTNHDENSWKGTVFERMGDGHKAFALLTFTVPGIPLIYSGQEAGLNKRLKFFDKDQIDWTDQSLTPFYTQLNELKAEHSALWNGTAGGSFEQLSNNQPDKVVAFVREIAGSKVITIINLSDDEVTVDVETQNHKGSYVDYFSRIPMTLEEKTTLGLKAWAYYVFITN